MITAFLLGLRLSWPTAGAARLRTALMVGAAAIGSVVMLGVLAVSRAEQVLHPGLYTDPGMRRVLLATVLAIAMPVLVLLSVAAKLSAQLRERRLANLRLLGLSPSRTRVVAVTEVAVSAAAGALTGVGIFWLLRPLASHLSVDGRSWSTSVLTPTIGGYAAVLVAVPVAVTVVAALPRRADRAGSVAVAHAGTTNRPSWLRSVPFVAGAVICAYVVIQAHGKPDATGLILPFFAGVILLGLGVVLVVPVFVRLVADLLLAASGRPVLLIAGRRLQAQPAAVNRLIGGLLIGLFLVTGARGVVAAFESTPQYLREAAQIEQVQRVTVTTSTITTSPVVSRAAGVDGVTSTSVFPVVKPACSRCELPYAVVASCDELRAVGGTAVRGCVDDAVMRVAGSSFQVPHGPGPPLSWRSSPPGAPRGALPVALPRPTADLRGIGWLGDLLGVGIVISPGLPGVSQLVAQTAAQVLVIGSPGRDLSTKLAQAGLTSNSYLDVADYNFVAKLRALVWAIATVIVSVGLLAFAIGAIDRAIARRREVVSLQLVGMSTKLLRLTQWVEAAVPLALGSLLAIGSGLLASATYLSIGGKAGAVPWRTGVTLALVAAAGSVAVAALTVVASSPRIRPDLIRSE